MLNKITKKFKSTSTFSLARTSPKQCSVVDHAEFHETLARMNHLEQVLQVELQKNLVLDRNCAALLERVGQLGEIRQMMEREVAARTALEHRVERMEKRLSKQKSVLKELKASLINADVYLDLEKRKNYELKQRLQHVWSIVTETSMYNLDVQ